MDRLLEPDELAGAETSEFCGREGEIGVSFQVRLNSFQSMGGTVSVGTARALAFKLLDKAYEAEMRMERARYEKERDEGKK